MKKSALSTENFFRHPSESVIAREAKGRPKQSVFQKSVSIHFILKNRLLRFARNDTFAGMRALFRTLMAGLLLVTFSSIARAEEIFQEITIQPGDTMWSLSNKYLKDPHRWPDIVKYNQLPTSDPTVALPGTRIRVPILLIKEEYRNAELISLIPEVRYQRRGSEQWVEAKQNMILHYEDSLRTLKAGKARIKFPSKEIVQINENSYVVLKPEKILQEIELIQGDIRASRARVILPNGTVVHPKGANSDYQAKIKDDDTELVFVYKGKVDVTAKGKTVTVREGFGTEIPKSAPPLNPMPLKSFVDFNPADMPADVPMQTKIEPAKGLVTMSPPASSLKMQAETKGSKAVVSKELFSSYHLQLSRNDKFTQIILDKTFPFRTPFDYKKQPIPDGTYHMRVAFIDTLGIEGPYSDPTPITKDTVAPIITSVNIQDNQKFTQNESYADVKGAVTGASMVSVNGDVVFITNTGEFTKIVPLDEGANVIRVLARDVAGNEAVIERKVTYSKTGK